MSSIWWALNWIGSQFSTQRRLQLWLSIAPHLRRLMLYPLELRAHRVKLWPLLLAEDKAVLPADPSPIASGVRRTAAQRKWVVYPKRPFAGPAQVLTYLSRWREPPARHRRNQDLAGLLT